MAFSSTVVSTITLHGKKMAWGTWTSGSTTGGDISTGMMTVESIMLTPTKSSVATNAVVVNETLPLNGTDVAVTIVTDSGVDGSWFAVGI